MYRVYVAYSMTSSVSLSLTLRLQKGAVVLSRGDLPIATVSSCNPQCFAVFYVAETNEFNLDLGTWNVTISSSSVDSNLKIVRTLNFSFLLQFCCFPLSF